MMVSQIGFGGIPIQRISEEDAIAVVNRCIELDVNFIDTANSYTTSELRIGKAVARHRDGLILATKSLARTEAELTKHLQQSLKLLGVESIDLFQLHCVSDSKTLDNILKPNGLLSVVEKIKKQGLIKHIGITSHQIDIAKEAVNSGKFETIMFPFNFVACEAANELLPIARKMDVGFIAMKPFAGGVLDNASLVLKYLLQYSDISIIPGIEKVSEIDEVINIIHSPAGITETEQTEMKRIREGLSESFCHRCDYCQPCTAEVPISLVLTWPTLLKRFPPDWLFMGIGAHAMEKVVNCNECGECEVRCPYNIPIMTLIKSYYEGYKLAKLQFLNERGNK